MFVHLKGDLEVDPIDWINCLDPYDASDDSRPASRRGPLTSYGIAKDMQELLSGIRTDLDSFSEAEAYALMTSAYRMTEYQFKYQKCVEGFASPAQAEPWKFLEIENSMKGYGQSYDYLKKLLTAGNSLAFKVWQIDPFLKYGLRGALMLLAAAIAAAFYWRWEKPLPAFLSNWGTALVTWPVTKLEQLARTLPTLTFRQIAFAIAALFSGYLLARILTSLLGDFLAGNVLLLVRWKDTLRRIVMATLLSTIGFVASVIHLYIFDRRFLRLGTLQAVKQKSE